MYSAAKTVGDSFESIKFELEPLTQYYFIIRNFCNNQKCSLQNFSTKVVYSDKRYDLHELITFSFPFDKNTLQLFTLTQLTSFYVKLSWSLISHLELDFTASIWFMFDENVLFYLIHTVSVIWQITTRTIVYYMREELVRLSYNNFSTFLFNSVGT